MTAQDDPRGLTPGSRLDPVTQSRGYVGGGVFPAGPAGPALTPERNYFEVGSNSVAKSGVVCGILAVPLGWIQVIGFVFALGFGGTRDRPRRNRTAPGRSASGQWGQVFGDAWDRNRCRSRCLEDH